MDCPLLILIHFLNDMSIKTEHIVRVLKIENRKPEEAELFFLPSNEAKSFHCFICGRFQFYHQHKIVAFVQDDMSQVLNSPPISPQCPKCGTIFHVHVL
jgi:hypothetical protein